MSDREISRRDVLGSVIGLAGLAFAPEQRVLAGDPPKQVAPFVVGDIFPDIRLPGPGGDELSLAASLKGRVALIDFWGTWCGPCIAELPDIARTYARLRDETFTEDRNGEKHIIGTGFTVFSVALHGDADDHDQWAKAVAAKPITWDLHVGTEDDALLRNTYRVAHFPTHYVIDRDMRLIDVGGDPRRLPFLLRRFLAS